MSQAGSTAVGSSTSPITPTNGGTGVSNPPAHTLPVAEGAAPFHFLGPLVNGQLLIGSTGADPVPSTLATTGTIAITNSAGNINLDIVTPVSAANGGTGASSPTAHSLPVAEGASAYHFVGPLTNGQLLIGSTGNDPVAANINAGAGITVTNGSGTITIATSFTPPLTWNVVNSNQSMLPNNGYIVNWIGGGTIVLTLPATSNVGDTIAVLIDGAAAWQIAQNAGQRVVVAGDQTKVGTGGTATSTGALGDSVTMVCTVANTKWVCTSVVGNISVVVS